MKKSKIVFLLSILSVSALTCIVCAGKSFFRLWGRMKEQGSGFRNSINAIYRGNGEIMCIVLSVREIVGMEPPVFIELNN